MTSRLDDARVTRTRYAVPYTLPAGGAIAPDLSISQGSRLILRSSLVRRSALRSSPQVRPQMLLQALPRTGRCRRRAAQHSPLSSRASARASPSPRTHARALPVSEGFLQPLAPLDVGEERRLPRLQTRQPSRTLAGDERDGLRLGALRPFGGVVLHLRVLVEGLVALADDRAVMNEKILTAAFVGDDEPVPLVGVEPLYGSGCHRCNTSFTALERAEKARTAHPGTRSVVVTAYLSKRSIAGSRNRRGSATVVREMFFLWRFVGFRRLIVLFLLRQAWRIIRGRRSSGRRTRPSTGIDAAV